MYLMKSYENLLNIFMRDMSGEHTPFAIELNLTAVLFI